MIEDEYDSEWAHSHDWDPADDDDDDNDNDDDSEFGDIDVVPCPECGREIFDDAPQCPHCGNFVMSDVSVWSARPRWWIVLGLLGMLAVIISLAFSF